MAEDTQVLNDERHRAEAMASHNTGGLAMPSERWLPLAALLDLSRELSNILVPVQPTPEYRAELYRRLLTEAHRQQALRLLSLPVGSIPAPEESRTMIRRVYLEYGPGGRRWIVGVAAVGSAASLVGLLAYVRSRRHGKAA
jgi:hypothetical protein